MIEVVYHGDAGHGWFFFSHELLEDIGLSASSFSVYSYRDNTGVYAEEDLDASIALTALKVAKGNDSFTVREQIVNGYSPIRDKERCQ